MALTLSAADAALKEDYQPSIREQLNNEIMMLAQIESRSTDVEGRRAVLSLHVTRNSGVGPRAEGGTLPTAGSQGYVEERVSLKYNYGRIQINGPVIRAMKSDTGSFTRAVESESTGVVRDLKREVNWQSFNNVEGTIAQCDTTTASTEVELQATTDSATMRRFEIGMKVDVGTLASPASLASASAITAIDVDEAGGTQSITISDSVTTTSSHYVTLAGSKAAAGATLGLTGIRAIVAASGTLFNVNPSTYPVWKSTVNSNSGTNRAFTDNLVEQVIDEIWLQSGEAPTFAVTSPGARRNYAAQLKAQKRFTDTVDLKGGFKALTVDAGNTSLALAVDRDCPDNSAFLLNLGCLTQHQSSDWEFMDEDGAVLNRVPGVDAYEATLFKYHELTTDRRNVHGLISDLLES